MQAIENQKEKEIIIEEKKKLEAGKRYLQTKYPLSKCYQSPLASIPMLLYLFEVNVELLKVLKSIEKKISPENEDIDGNRKKDI